jgi:hypothetical protein
VQAFKGKNAICEDIKADEVQLVRCASKRSS